MTTPEELKNEIIQMIDETYGDYPEDMIEIIIKRAKSEWCKPYIEMLKIAKCPDCYNVGWYAVPNHKTGEPEQQQCRFCYERNLLLNASEPE